MSVTGGGWGFLPKFYITPILSVPVIGLTHEFKTVGASLPLWCSKLDVKMTLPPGADSLLFGAWCWVPLFAERGTWQVDFATSGLSVLSSEGQDKASQKAFHSKQIFSVMC